MATPETIPETYPDPEYEQAHRATYERKPRFPIKPVLPPGVREADFAKAIDEFVGVVGKDAVFCREGLSDYIDPYDVHEHEQEEGRRKVPGAAVWYLLFILFFIFFLSLFLSLSPFPPFLPIILMSKNPHPPQTLSHSVLGTNQTKPSK